MKAWSVNEPCVKLTGVVPCGLPHWMCGTLKIQLSDCVPPQLHLCFPKDCNCCNHFLCLCLEKFCFVNFWSGRGGKTSFAGLHLFSTPNTWFLKQVNANGHWISSEGWPTCCCSVSNQEIHLQQKSRPMKLGPTKSRPRKSRSRQSRLRQLRPRPQKSRPLRSRPLKLRPRQKWHLPYVHTSPTWLLKLMIEISWQCKFWLCPELRHFHIACEAHHMQFLAIATKLIHVFGWENITNWGVSPKWDFCPRVPKLLVQHVFPGSVTGKQIVDKVRSCTHSNFERRNLVRN